MAASGPEGTVHSAQGGGWVLCEQAGGGRPGATIAHLVNRAAAHSPGCDIAVAFGIAVSSPGWEQALRDAALAESTAATVSAMPVSAAGGREGESAALEEALRAGRGAILAGSGPADPLPLVPRVSLVTGPLVYIVRAAFDLLGGMDEGLSSSTAAVADLGLRAREQGLANLATTAVLVASDRSVLLDDDDRAELTRRFTVLWDATADPPTGALERAAVLTRLAVERKLDVTVDARALGAATGGTHTYTFELLRALDATGEVRVRALFAESIPAELAELENTTAITYREALDGVQASDLVHRPQQVFSVDDLNLLQPLGHRLVITQLDLIAYHSPNYFPDVEAWRRHVRATRVALDAADLVLFLSDHARRDAEREDLIDRERTAVVALGVNPVTAAEESVRPAGLEGRDEPFLLCLGSDYAHKNRPFALELTAALRRVGWPGILVFAGGHVEHGSSALVERAILNRDSDLAGSVVDVGAVSEPERRWLMAHARAVAYPTVLEGFGLIPMEAAAAGAPCLFAAQSSLGELLPADLATLDRWDPRRSALAVLPLLADGAARAANVSAIREAIRAYTWERCAHLTLEAYRATLSTRARLSARAAWEAHARELEIVRLDSAVGDLQRRLDDFSDDAVELVGPHGLLSAADQRALLALASRRLLRRTLFAALQSGYRVLHRPHG
jgi:glycosyltransferase involved in cell wall biosynthesis